VHRAAANGRLSWAKATGGADINATKGKSWH
jgi:hypothetical protein